MNYRGILFLLGRLLLALTAALAAPTIVAYVHRGEDWWSFLYAGLLAGVVGITLERTFAQPKNFPFGRREAFVLVAAAWVTASLVGALPYIFHYGISFWIDAIFESTSGFTTTGASIMTDIEGQPRGILLWRSLSHWLGGMGIIVLGIAVLPKLAIGGMELLGAEAPGPVTEKLTPRIAQTAKALWGIYALLTAAVALTLWLLGVGSFDAINHAFSTIATAGFSTLDASVGGFNRPAVEMVIVVFMILAGANFALHFQLLRGRPGPLFRDAEFRLYLTVIASATVLIAADLMINGGVGSLLEAVRLSSFQSTAIVTTTGFSTADFDQWPHFSRALLFLLMFVGGCAGSTSGSVKVVRGMIVLKKLAIDLKRLVRPRAVYPIRIGKRAIPEGVVTSVTTFMLLFVSIFAAGGLILSLMGLDMVTAYSASAAALGNIGPGQGLVGPAQNYAVLPGAAKLLLTGMMIVGRLELYTVLVLFFLGWRRP